MRSNLRILLIGVMAATMTVGPATVCRSVYGCWGCGPVYVEPCYSGCYAPCEVVEVSPCSPCGTGGAQMKAEGAGEGELPAPSMPAKATPTETLVPPQVPATHEPKPAQPPQQVMPTAPMEQPAQPAMEPAPAEAPAPAEEGLDDLFGPSSEEPTNGGGLFGPSGEEEGAAPTEMEVEETVEEGPLDSLFGAPAEEPAEESAAPAETSEEIDDFFGTPAEETPAPAEPVEEAAPAEEEEGTNLDDLFGGADAILSEPGGLTSTGLRRWIDNTGQYSCRGRLIDMLEGQVRLLKDNGHTTTVPLDRLSQDDQQFVQRQASAELASSVDRTVHTTPAWPAH